jgi:hypothetical protein
MMKVAEARNRHFNIEFSSLAVFILILLLCTDELPARPVTAEQAEKAVTGWLKADSQPLGTVLAQQTKSVQAFTNEQNEPLYYIVYLQPSGFVIVAADDLVEPIIGFSRAETYDPSPENPLGAIVSRDLPNRIAAARNFLKSAGPDTTNSTFKKALDKWATLEDYADTVQLDSLPGVSDVRVPPLIQSLWDQGSVCSDYCYNYYTPNHYICGCVATAMAQLMRFHEYPLTGIGVHPFTIYVNGSPQTAYTMGGDGSGGGYYWDLMVLEPGCGMTDSQRQAIGALCYDAGVSANMNYGSLASYAYMNKAQEALTDTFYYSNAVIQSNYPITIPEPNLIGMVNPGLDANHPVLFGIYDTVNYYGHAIVCDGYGYNMSTLYHHLNMGWGGWRDAWYDLPDIDCTPGAPVFNVVDTCIYNIFTSGSGEIISGRITDPSDDPLEGVTVTAYGSGGPYTALTNDQGIYGLAKVPSNTTFTVEAEKENWGIPSQIVTTGVSTSSSNTSGNRWGIDFTATVINPAGFVEFDKDIYEVPQSISVKLIDSDLEGFGSQDVVLEVCDGDMETLMLTENPAGSSVFTGSIAAVEGSASSEDGTIQVSVSQIIIAAYEDANDGTGKAATARDTAAIRPQSIIFQTDFTEQPEGWSVVDGGESAHTWEPITEYDDRTSDYWTGMFMIVDSDDAGNYAMDEQLITHNIDCSDYENVELKFNHYFRYYGYGEDEICDVDVRINGGGWQNVIRFEGQDTEGVVELPLSGFGADGASDVEIRWHYYDAEFEYWWGIDDVEITGALVPEQTLGDFEPDCDVDLDDLDILGSAWLSSPGSDNWNASADIYETGGEIVDFMDFAAFAQNWLTGVP